MEELKDFIYDNLIGYGCDGAFEKIEDPTLIELSMLRLLVDSAINEKLRVELTHEEFGGLHKALSIAALWRQGKMVGGMDDDEMCATLSVALDKILPPLKGL